MEIDDLIHDDIREESFDLYEKGFYRESMINSILCLFDMIRNQAGLQDDGSNLVGKAFSIDNPRLILADLQSESGRNIQKGIIQLLQGYFQAYRNVGSHSLHAKFNEKDALSVLIAVSRLYEQIIACDKAIFLRHDGMYIYKEDLYHKYLRFYEDGCVISVISLGEPSDVVNWFNRENAEDFKKYSVGKYETNDRTVEFFTESESGKVNYNAVIRPDLLHTKSESLINGNKSEYDYKFISWNEIKA